MKYKNIDSMLHNFGHSFVSFTNYVDGDFIIDLLPGLARNTPGFELSIDFMKGSIEPPLEYPRSLIKSVSYAQAWIPRLASSQNIEVERLSDIRLRFRVLKAGYEVIVSAVDDRKEIHKVFVHSTPLT